MKQNGVFILRLAAVLVLCLGLLGVRSMVGKVSLAGEAEFLFAGTRNDADAACFFSGGACVVIDAGEAADGPHLVEVLQSRKVKQIDCMILTHPDQDHVGGALALLAAFPVRQILTACDAGEKEVYQEVMRQAEERQIPVAALSRERQFRFGGIKLHVYPPDQPGAGSTNENSLAVLAQHGQVTLFLAGDAEKDRMQQLLEYHLPAGVDLYKVAHHGRDSSAGAALIGQLRPRNAVVTASQPESGTAAALADQTCAVYTTVGQDVWFVSDQKQLKLAAIDPLPSGENP